MEDVFATMLLTPRQKQIVILICDDLATDEIARRLGITSKTVEFHRQRIRDVLGVRGTAGIMRCAIKAGLVEIKRTLGDPLQLS